MPSTYIPRRDADLDAWLANFAALIAAAPADYGLTAPDAIKIGGAVSAWHTAFALATAPTTRTRIAVQEKDRQRGITLRIIREYAATIRVNSAVSNALKVGLGLHVSSRANTADSAPPLIGPPATTPTVGILGLTVGSQTLHIADASTPARRARPAGTAGVLLYRAVADGPVSHPDQASFLALVTRPKFQSLFAPGGTDHGKTATYFARWVSAKGQVGPWSAPASMRIAA